jgi:hypothetical protein
MSTMFFEDDKDDSLVGDFAAAAEHGYEAAKAEDKAKKEAEAKELFKNNPGALVSPQIAQVYINKKQYEHLSYLLKNGMSMNETGFLSTKN